MKMTLRILVAEDDLINQQIALSLLHNIGYQADLVDNGCQVLSALAQQRYDVILMDVHMPKMDGLETTQRILAQYSAAERPVIIALTTVRQDLCSAAGMDAYLSKPLDINLLKRLLNHYGQQKRTRTEPANTVFFQSTATDWPHWHMPLIHS
jgi:CheY-like chemotaxis protein